AIVSYQLASIGPSVIHGPLPTPVRAAFGRTLQHVSQLLAADPVPTHDTQLPALSLSGGRQRSVRGRFSLCTSLGARAGALLRKLGAARDDRSRALRICVREQRGIAHWIASRSLLYRWTRV